MTMSSTIKQIFSEFQETIEQFCRASYDILNIENMEFEDDFFKFKQRIKELERRLASVLTNSFDDCDTIIGKFKLLESFEGLLTRPIIQDELEKKQINLLELYKADLKTVAQVFQEGKPLVERLDESAPIGSNMAPISGAISWTTGLYERVSEPFQRLMTLPQSLQDREEYKDVRKIFESLSKNLNEFESLKIDEWEKGVEENTDDQLNKFLIAREPTPLAEEGFIRVNFNPILTRYLREIRYLQLLDIDVPQRASSLYAKVEVYRSQTGRLDIIVEKYNNIIATLLPVEKPLMADRLANINKTLQPGIDTLKWNSTNIDQFINQSMAIVETVDELVKRMKDNVRQMIEKMNKWSANPLYTRRPRTLAPEDVESIHNANVTNRFDEIEKEGKDIMKLQKDTVDSVRPNKNSPEWKAYVDYVNGLVIEGITLGISSSMLDLAQQISVHYNKINGLAPIFQINVCLSDRQISFDPSISQNENGNGIRDIINNITEHFISLAIKMPSRVDNQQGAGDYLVEIKDQFQLFGSMQQITNNLDEIEQESTDFLAQYDDIAFLWEQTLEESFQEFLKSGPDLRETFLKSLSEMEDLEEEHREVEIESFDAMANKILAGVTTQLPSLEAFDEKITFLHEVKNRIATVKPFSDIGWIKVNSTPLIKEMQLIIDEWIDKFTKFLLNNTTL
jgi:dynein heavy chain